MHGSDSWFNCVNCNSLPAIWKCKASYSSSSSDRSESDSCSCCNYVKYFFIFLKSFVIFVTIFAWMYQDELDVSSSSFSASGELMDGCPFFCNLNIPCLSIILYQKVYCPFLLCCPFLSRLYGLYRLAQTPFLCTVSPFVQLYFCTCRGGAESVDGSLGTSCHW